MANAPQYQDSGIKQPYHLVSPSAWPILAAFAAGLLAMGTVAYMHDIPILGMAPGLKGTIFGMLLVFYFAWRWWGDIIKEAFVERAHSPVTKIGLRYGMALFIASEVCFFAAFFWAFFNAALFPTEAIGFVWPPKSVEVINAFEMPLMMTLVLLLSGTTCTWAHHEIMHGNNKEAAKALFITILLGVIFTAFQAYEYVHATFGFKDGIYSSAFYMATGFHGLHVLLGTVFLIVCYFRTVKGHFTPESHFGFEAAAWYWHFVDVVWLFLFVAVYWWGGSGGTVAAH